MDLEEFNQLKADVEYKRTQANQAKGALELLEAQLKKDYGIKPDELTQAIHDLENEIKKEEIEYEKGLEKWKLAWGDKLQEEQ